MKCRHCGEEIVQEQNPRGPETWREAGNGPWGCLQAAWDRDNPGEDDEPDFPYPPHEPA